jgi:16S rRNA G966 N2-methylase RsmD
MNNILELEYPYYKYSVKFNKKEIKQKIKKYTPVIYDYIPNDLKNSNLTKYDNKYFIIKEDYVKSIDIINITNYFTERERVKCRFGNNISPLKYWNINKKSIIKKAIAKYKEVNINNLREIIYDNAKLCNNFRITVCMTILNFFKPKKWLDISAGWGDRLLSAIFCKIKLYVSADPNIKLHKGYSKIIETFAKPSKRSNYIIFKNGFLEAPIPDKKFDIVFTSPPFFKLEIYSNYEEDSVTKFDSEKEWCDNFFMKSLVKAYNHLKNGGHIILYMGGSDYVMESMHKLDKIMKYKGIIYFYENKPRSIYVWEKIDEKILLKI